MLNRAGVTVIYSQESSAQTVKPSIPVNYRQASLLQVTRLVERSKYCYMPVRIDCIATKVSTANVPH